MKREGSIRQNYIKDEYTVVQESSIDARIRTQKQLDVLKHKGYQLALQDMVINDQTAREVDLVVASGGLQLKNDQQYNFQELYNVKLYFA